MTKFFLLLTFFLISINFQAQTKTDSEPLKYKKIKFVYKAESTIKFTNNGVYLDTLILQWEFPNVKYKLTNSINDSLKKVGFISKKEINQNIKSKLSSIIFHTNTIHTYIFKVKNKKTTLNTCFCCEEKTKEIYKQYFNENCPETNSTCQYTFIVNYDKQKYYLSDCDKTQEFTFFDKKIEWDNKSETTGSYNVDINYKTFENSIIINKKLPKYITPNEFFQNNEFGIEKVSSIYYTKELVSVEYF